MKQKITHDPKYHCTGCNSTVGPAHMCVFVGAKLVAHRNAGFIVKKRRRSPFKTPVNPMGYYPTRCFVGHEYAAIYGCKSPCPQCAIDKAKARRLAPFKGIIQEAKDLAVVMHLLGSILNPTGSKIVPNARRSQMGLVKK